MLRDSCLGFCSDARVDVFANIRPGRLGNRPISQRPVQHRIAGEA